MRQLYMITYRLREGLGEDDLRKLTKQFADVGNARASPPTTCASTAPAGSSSSSGKTTEASYENILRYQPWIHAEAIAATTVEDAFPVIQRVYG